MQESEGWQQVLKPHLESLVSNSWIDPRKAKKDKELVYQYTVAWANANAAKEILSFVEQQEDILKTLQAKKKGELKNNFNIGE